MAYLDNSKFKEIREAARKGDEKAKMVLQAMIKGDSQDNVSRLADAYYGIQPNITPQLEEVPAPVADVEQVEEVEEIKEEPIPEEIPQNVEPVQPEAETKPVIEDLTEILDKELDGIIDSQEIKETSFKDFLSNKKNDGLRTKKTVDYFRAFDPQGRENYLNSKVASYRDSFNENLKGINRNHKDLDDSLNKYSQSVNDMLDDEEQLDMNVASDVYDLITDDSNMMLGLRRGHDENDFNEVVEALNVLVKQYGKKNVQAALNTLRSDNNNYRDYRNNQIDEEIKRYSGNLEKLLK